MNKTSKPALLHLYGIEVQRREYGWMTMPTEADGAVAHEAKTNGNCLEFV
jgi:hypothetical protein